MTINKNQSSNWFLKYFWYLWDHLALLLPPLKADFVPRFPPPLLPPNQPIPLLQPAKETKEKTVVTQPFPPGLTRHIRNNGCITILLLEKTKMIVSPVVNSKQNYFSTLHKMVSDILAIFSNIHWHHISVLTILSKLKNFSWFCSAVHTWNLAKEFFHSFLFYYSSIVDFLFPLP